MLEPIYTVYHSSILDADPDRVWIEMRDIMRTLDIIFGSDIEGAHWVNGGSVDRVPSRYEFTVLPGRDVALEEVVGRSEQERSLTYRSIGQVLEIYDYVATYRVLAVTNDPRRCFLEYTRQFRVTSAGGPDFAAFIETLFDQEIDSVRAYFAA
ncbi:MAG TPA: SRPBCC family protein [Solirubrobacteraceae bacterium]